jgi:hypothetical protein
MTQPPPGRFRFQHFVIALIAVVVAVAMALNYYLW